MKRVLSLCAALLALILPSLSQASITCTASDFIYATTATSTTSAVMITVPSQTYRRPFINIVELTDETSTATVADNNGGHWTIIGPDDHSNGAAVGRQWFAYQSTLGGTGSTTITVTFSASVTSYLVAGTCYSDTASLDYTSSAAYTEIVSLGTITSNTRTSTTTGVIVGNFMSTSGACDISSVGTNQTEMTSPIGSRRVQMITRPEASAGTYDITANLAFNCTAQMGAHLFQEAGGAPAANFYYRRRGQ